MKVDTLQVLTWLSGVCVISCFMFIWFMIMNIEYHDEMRHECQVRGMRYDTRSGNCVARLTRKE